MIKKLIISAVVLTALISGKEANAAGAAGFARSLSTSFAQSRMAELAPAVPSTGFTARKRSEVFRISAAVEQSIQGVDAYLDMFAAGDARAAAPQGCVDCADIKRDQLIGLGWSADAMRIAYSISAEGRVQRVLVVDTALGELLVGDGRPSFIGETDAQDIEPAFTAAVSYEI